VLLSLRLGYISVIGDTGSCLAVLMTRAESEPESGLKVSESMLLALLSWPRLRIVASTNVILLPASIDTSNLLEPSPDSVNLNRTNVVANVPMMTSDDNNKPGKRRKRMMI